MHCQIERLQHDGEQSYQRIILFIYCILQIFHENKKFYIRNLQNNTEFGFTNHVKVSYRLITLKLFDFLEVK